MKKIYLPIQYLLLLIAINNQAIESQINHEWINIYNDSIKTVNNQLEYSNDVNFAMTTDNAGNIYILGFSTFNDNTRRSVLIKYNSSGNMLWKKSYPSIYSYEYYFPKAIATDYLGNIYCTFIKNTTLSKYFTIKYDSNGTVIWTAEYSSYLSTNETCNINIGNDGSVYVIGTCADTSQTSYDICAVKYNSSGIQQWVTRFNGIGNREDVPIASGLDNLQNLIISGYTTESPAGGNQDFCTLKYNQNGVLQWLGIYESEGNDEIEDMVLDSLGNIYITGFTSTSPTHLEFCTIKYNSSGSQQWLSKYPGINSYNFNYSYGIDVDHFGNVYITGFTEKNFGLEDYATIKYNSNGVQQWINYFNGSGNSIDIASDIKVDNDGNSYVAGISQSTTGLSYAILKYNTNGIQQWIGKVDSSGDYTSCYPILNLDNTNGVYVSGTRKSNLYRYDMVLVKYSRLIGIEPINKNIPNSFSLSQNYPNPFNPSTKIKFDVPADGKGQKADVQLIIYNSLGQQISVLVKQQLLPGVYEAEWDASGYSSGIYFYKLESGDYSETKIMVLIK